MASFNNQRWTECCTVENIRFAKKGTLDYERVNARYKNDIIEPAELLLQDDVFMKSDKRACWRKAILTTKGSHGMAFLPLSYSGTTQYDNVCATYELLKQQFLEQKKYQREQYELLQKRKAAPALMKRTEQELVQGMSEEEKRVYYEKIHWETISLGT